jgi:Ion channel
MYEVIAICAATGLATVLLHHAGLLRISALALRFAPGRAGTVMLGVVAGIFLLHLAEIGIYSAAIGVAIDALHLGRLVGDVDGSNLELLYFSAETYTSLGFGDILPSGPMRLLASFEPLNGLILLGWSASFVHVEVDRFWRLTEPEPAARNAAVRRTPALAPKRSRRVKRRRYCSSVGPGALGCGSFALGFAPRRRDMASRSLSVAAASASTAASGGCDRPTS